MSSADVQIREITPEDATAVSALNEELGYPASPGAVQKRIQDLIGRTGEAVYVACLSGEVVGWIQLSETRHLQSEPRAEIGGLVVSSQVRGGGIGRRLVERGEQWARERGLRGMVVRSQIKREAAHRFYLREGYARTKTSAVFTKDLL